MGVQGVHSPFVLGILYSDSRELVRWGKEGGKALGEIWSWAGSSLTGAKDSLNHNIWPRLVFEVTLLFSDLKQEMYPRRLPQFYHAVLSNCLWIYHRFTSKLFYFQPQGYWHLWTNEPRILGIQWCDSCFRVDSYSSSNGTMLKCSLNIAPFLSCTTFIHFLVHIQPVGYVWAWRLPICNT